MSGSLIAFELKADDKPSGLRAHEYWVISKSDIAGQRTIPPGKINFYPSQIQIILNISNHLISTTKNQAVFGYECSSVGDFSITAPVDLGEVWGLVFLDAQGSGISKDDPHGRSSEFTIKTKSIDGITITLQTEKVVEEAFQINPPLDAAKTLDPKQERVVDPVESSQTDE